MTQLTELLRASERVVAFTGAGVSTESGIPDFRSPGGIWTRYDASDFSFEKYIASAAVRARSWAIRREFFAKPVVPNPAHHALAQLEKAGRSLGVITQNIDGLHQDAGSSKVVEVHGTARQVMCIGHDPRDGAPEGCGWRGSLDWALKIVDDGDPDPSCPSCGGMVKSATVSFGQRLFQREIDEATQLAASADLMLAVGSSLQVYPAAELPLIALRAGARLVIVNDEPTPLDEIAHQVVRGRAADVLKRAVDQVLS